MAAFVHSKLHDSQYLTPGGSETELCWTDLRMLSNRDVFHLACWACERLAVFTSNHAQALLHIDAKPEVQLLPTFWSVVKHDKICS